MMTPASPRSVQEPAPLPVRAPVQRWFGNRHFLCPAEARLEATSPYSPAATSAPVWSKSWPFEGFRELVSFSSLLFVQLFQDRFQGVR